VELIGPLVRWWRNDIWTPMRGTARVAMRTFPAHDVACYLSEAERFAATVSADLVYVSKPRFPGAVLGDMIAGRGDLPLLLDVDDDETALDDGTGAMRRATLELIDEAAAVTVSSAPLRDRFGGTLIPQARDERRFDPALYDRDALRAELGYGPQDVVVLFLGTARRHKGVLEAAQALQELADPRLRLCVIGPFSDESLLDELTAYGPDQVRLLGPRPVDEVPQLLSAGDLVCLHQDTTSEVATHQIPMKLTEALAMEVPVLATLTPALMPFADSGVIATVDDGSLAEEIARALAEPEATRERARRGREYFLEHLSYNAVGPVLDDVLASARPQPRPRLSVAVARARKYGSCSKSGPAQHAEDDRRVAQRLIREFGRDVRANLRDVLQGVSSCALIGYPSHRNPGDHAIWLGAKRLLRELGAKVVYECDWRTYSRDALAAGVDAGAVIVFTGGGNFGDLWPNTQELRERVLTDFPGVPTIQLPQSIEFEAVENRERVRRLLERHGNVQLLLREPRSLERARQWFDVPSQLVPDVAFVVAPPPAQAVPVADVVWVARTDKESLGFFPPADTPGVEVCDWMPPPDAELSVSPEVPDDLPARLKRQAQIVRAAAKGEEIDHFELARLRLDISRDRFALACSVLHRGRVIVTDRLHVHLMAMQLGIPTVLADNSYGKVKAIYDAFTVASPTVRWARSPADALEVAQRWAGELEHLVIEQAV
jgi:exopolysaccharide biosynthesis predicted pyruvyltransferase EpsI/glycosyltransferase involved in cell wall biosynthesis